MKKHGRQTNIRQTVKLMDRRRKKDIKTRFGDMMKREVSVYKLISALTYLNDISVSLSLFLSLCLYFVYLSVCLSFYLCLRICYLSPRSEDGDPGHQKNCKHVFRDKFNPFRGDPMMKMLFF